MDPDTGEPSDNLTEVAVKFCKSLTCEAKTVSGILSSNDEKIMKAIKEGIDRANAKAVSRAQKVGRVLNRVILNLSTNRLSILITILFLNEEVERICLKIKAFFL